MTLLQKLGAPVESGATPSAGALILVTPVGGDATSAATEQGLDPKRTVAVDTLFPMVKRRTIMGTPLTDTAFRRMAHGLLASDGVPVTVCRDSPGFIAQRIVAMIVNIGCSIAQSRTAEPPDIDKAVTLASDANERRRLREHLDVHGRASSLFDTAATTRALELAYHEMADQYRRQVRQPIRIEPA
jgi:hypothetical protein